MIAEVDGEWTMKYFKKENGQVHLEAAKVRSIPFSPSFFRLCGHDHTQRL